MLLLIFNWKTREKRNQHIIIIFLKFLSFNCAIDLVESQS